MAKIYATGIWLLLSSHQTVSLHHPHVSQRQRKSPRSLPAGRKRNKHLPTYDVRAGNCGLPMKIEIILKAEEKERLLLSTAENSQACSVLAAAQSASHQPELVAMICDEIEAAEILELAQQHCGSAWRAINWQMRRLGMLSSSFGEKEADRSRRLD